MYCDKSLIAERMRNVNDIFDRWNYESGMNNFMNILIILMDFTCIYRKNMQKKKLYLYIQEFYDNIHFDGAVS